MRKQTLLLVSAVAALALFAGSAAAVADGGAQSLSTQCHDPFEEDICKQDSLSVDPLSDKDVINHPDVHSISASPLNEVGTFCHAGVDCPKEQD